VDAAFAADIGIGQMICARPWRRLSEIRQLVPTWIWPALVSRVSPPEGSPRLCRQGLGSIDLTSLSSVTVMAGGSAYLGAGSVFGQLLFATKEMPIRTNRGARRKKRGQGV
jgi:hypothetical protein